MFKIEEAQYIQEHIDFTQVKFEDNQGNIDLVEGKMGIFRLLDQECTMKQPSDANYHQLIQTQLSSHKSFLQGPKLKRNVFGIAHFAGDVVYNCIGFTDKNKNSQNRDTQDILCQSSVGMIQDIFGKEYDSQDLESDAKTKKGLPPAKKSISGQFVD